MRVRDRFRSALVTGAGSGLGAAFVDALLGEGLDVWGTSRTPGRLASRPRFMPVELELADAPSVERAWTSVEQASGGIDLLVNNAGGALFGPIAAIPPARRDREQAVLFRGPAQLASLAWSAMRARGRGAIVNVTSLAVEWPIPMLVGYNAAKAALAAFTATLAGEARGSGVCVLEFRPGDYRTNFNEAMRPGAGGSFDDPATAALWRRFEALAAAAPPPSRAARDLMAALARGRSGIVRSGGVFQTRVAPWGNRLLPGAMLRWLHRLYYGSGPLKHR
jgi:NAD(P)-dependent dehydrogenase (short-subunit alcohol dehydrogenase family)